MIALTPRTSVPDEAIEVQFLRASGPGGQHVNKVETAVQLRLHLDRAGLPAPLRARLEKLAGARLTRQGEIVIEARARRSQQRNREEALQRLGELVAAAEKVPRKRVPTKPGKAAKARRMDAKTKRGGTKRLRRPPNPSD